jgi:DNA-binding LytR/AlgR family response regulator
VHGDAVRVLVVDDEPLARARVARLLARIQGVASVAEAGSGAAAIAMLEKAKADVMLLDIEMPGISGLEVAKTPGMPAVIFTTAHVEYAARAFDLDAVDYLTKPIRRERLERALERVSRRVKAATTVAPAAYRIPVHGPSGIRFVDVARATTLRALDKYTSLSVDGEEHLVRESLDALEERLAESGFVRVHRAALVRVGAIAGLGTQDGALVAKLADGTSVEVSRRHGPALRRMLRLRR